jgi:hypothetical protein
LAITNLTKSLLSDEVYIAARVHVLASPWLRSRGILFNRWGDFRMAEFLKLEKSWLNVDKIIRIENHLESTAEPCLSIYYSGSERVVISGHDVHTMLAFLHSHVPHSAVNTIA